MTKEQEIKRNMEILGISREEAEELYKDDHSDEVLPEVAEMEKKVNELNRHYEKSVEKKERKSRKATKKEDPEKRMLIEFLKKQLSSIEVENVETTNPEQKISFSIGENNYTVTLTKHRPPKK